LVHKGEHIVRLLNLSANHHLKVREKHFFFSFVQHNFVSTYIILIFFDWVILIYLTMCYFFGTKEGQRPKRRKQKTKELIAYFKA